MSASRIVTTTEKFDEMGKLVERITKEEYRENEAECLCKKNKRISDESERGELRGWKACKPRATEPMNLPIGLGGAENTEERATEIKISWSNW